MEQHVLSTITNCLCATDVKTRAMGASLLHVCMKLFDISSVTISNTMQSNQADHLQQQLQTLL